MAWALIKSRPLNRFQTFSLGCATPLLPIGLMTSTSILTIACLVYVSIVFHSIVIELEHVAVFPDYALYVRIDTFRRFYMDVYAHFNFSTN